MPKNPLERAKEELLDNEELIWADTPDIQRRAHKKRKAAIFGKVVIIAVLLWMFGVIATSFSSGNLTGLALIFFGLPFLLVAKKLIDKPQRAKARAAETYYALTNQRLMIIDDFKKKSVQSYDIDKLEFLERTDHSDGTGNILFTKTMVTTVPTGNRENAPSPKAVTREIKTGFTDIHEAKDVEREIQKLMQNTPIGPV